MEVGEDAQLQASLASSLSLIDIVSLQQERDNNKVATTNYD